MRSGSLTRNSEPSPVPKTKSGKEAKTGVAESESTLRKKDIRGVGEVGVKKEKPEHHVSYNESSA